VLGGVEVKRWN